MIDKTHETMIIVKVTNNKEHIAALQRIEELIDIPEDDPRMYELLYLSELVADYEEHCYPTPALTPLETIKQLMEEYNLKQKDLVPIFGSKSMVSMILSGKRNMTVDKVQKLSEYFHVPSNLFIEGGSPGAISGHTPGTASNMDESLLSPGFLKVLRSTIHEELGKYLAADPKTKTE
jgi:HTH-type transcriptional regulator/antitoxin HigA